MENLTQEQVVELLQNFADWLSYTYNCPDISVEVIEEYLSENNQ
jgi:hypothetical protein